MTLESNLTAAFQAVGTDMKGKANAAALNASALTTGTVPIARLPAGAVIATTSATTRPSTRTDLVCLWLGGDPGANALAGDVWLGA